MVQGRMQAFESGVCVSQASQWEGKGDYFILMWNAYILNLVEYER